ncbi:unnamed protein product [Citrullus colocynthis]|uniref:Uncharacterized protein n=1 Tax=Citrullus colocynthis TaxID=252529 RepID=A0ABP0XVY3_9ROSI
MRVTPFLPIDPYELETCVWRGMRMRMKSEVLAVQFFFSFHLARLTLILSALRNGLCHSLRAPRRRFLKRRRRLSLSLARCRSLSILLAVDSLSVSPNRHDFELNTH